MCRRSLRFLTQRALCWLATPPSETEVKATDATCRHNQLADWHGRTAALTHGAVRARCLRLASTGRSEHCTSRTCGAPGQQGSGIYSRCLRAVGRLVASASRRRRVLARAQESIGLTQTKTGPRNPEAFLLALPH